MIVFNRFTSWTTGSTISTSIFYDTIIGKSKAEISEDAHDFDVFEEPCFEQEEYCSPYEEYEFD